VARGQAGLVTSPGVRLAAHQPGTPDARPLLPPPFQSSSGVCVFSSMARTAARTPRRSTRDLLRRFRQVEQEPPDRDHRNRAASGIDAFVLVPGEALVTMVPLRRFNSTMASLKAVVSRFLVY